MRSRWVKVGVWAAGILLAGVLTAALGVRYTESAGFCASCHVMRGSYETWFHSAHREVTNCNSCHVPQAMPYKLYYKAKSGAWDALIFYSGRAPADLRTKADSREIIQSNCVRCHQTLVREIGRGAGENCYDCHRFTPHGLRARSGPFGAE